MADLKQLKNQVLDELIVITDEADLSPLEKFDLTMTRYINTGDEGLLDKLYKTAKEIKDPKDRGSALMQLLEEIEIVQSKQAANQSGLQASQQYNTSDDDVSEPQPEPESVEKSGETSPQDDDNKA